MTKRLQDKDGYWYGIINYKDETGKYKKKWVATGLTVKGNNKRKAEEITQKAVQEFEVNYKARRYGLKLPHK